MNDGSNISSHQFLLENNHYVIKSKKKKIQIMLQNAKNIPHQA